jgi:peptidyl-tRNA hydrolase, PTH1 family
LKYLVTGLGNIGDEYDETRHNIGFTILDALARSCGIAFSKKRYGFIAECHYKGRTLILLKPSTYVNLSGKAVNYWTGKESVLTENIMVLVDDISLPFGTIRLRPGGGGGGHNGLTSIIETMGHQNFARLRFGIGSEYAYGKQIEHVLGKWTDEEKKQLPEKITVCHDIIRSFAIMGIEKTMNAYNNK